MAVQAIDLRDGGGGLLWVTDAPESELFNDVRPFDLKCVDYVPETGDSIDVFGRTLNGDWYRVNEWTSIRNRPTSITPALHALEGPEHFGRMSTRKLYDHDMRNRTHRKIAAIGLLNSL